MAVSKNANFRRRMRWMAATGILWLMALPVFAQSARHGKTADGLPNPCDHASTQMEMTHCSGEQYRKSDARLNAVYAKVLRNMERDLADAQRHSDVDQGKYYGAQIQKLKDAEAAWNLYRDLHCNAAGQLYEGGSMQPMIVSDCLKLTTDHRIEEIKQTYENEDLKLE